MIIKPISIYFLPPILTTKETQPLRDFWSAALLSGIYNRSTSEMMFLNQNDEPEFCVTAVLEYITTTSSLSELNHLPSSNLQNSFRIGSHNVSNSTIIEYIISTEETTVDTTSFTYLSNSGFFQFRHLATLIKSSYLIWDHDFYAEFPLQRLIEPSNPLKPQATEILRYHGIPTS